MTTVDIGPDHTIGRTAELRRLQAAWARARPGKPVVAGIEGAAGVGKTALVRSFVRSVASPDVAVRAARGRVNDGFPAPFQVLRELTGVRVEAGADPFLLGRRLGASLTRAAVLVVDDAHRADLPSLTTLRHALAAAPGRVLLVLVFRTLSRPAPRRPGAPDRRALFPALEMQELGGLSADALAELAVTASPERQRLPVEAARRLHERTGGNPLHAVQVLRQVGPREPVDRLGTAGGRERLEVLTGRQRAVAELALDGLTRRQIAARLDRSLKVVEGHLTAVFKRLGISGVGELREMFGR